MKYLAPVAELVSLETVSVILASGEEATTAAPTCPTETPEELI